MLQKAAQAVEQKKAQLEARKLLLVCGLRQQLLYHYLYTDTVIAGDICKIPGAAPSGRKGPPDGCAGTRRQILRGTFRAERCYGTCKRKIVYITECTGRLVCWS
jgi:hypothetical protein